MGKAKEKEVSNFKLPEESINLKFIKRKKGMAANVEDNHVISGGMLEKSVKKYCAPALRSGVIKNILTAEEKSFLETETDLNLSAYSEYWHTKYVNLYKQSSSNNFDLSDPSDYISYKILLANKDDIAPDWKSRNKKQTFQFAIVRDNEIGQESKKALDLVKDAWKAYVKIEDNREMLLSVISLLQDRQVAEDTKLEWLQGQVEERVDKEPTKFLTLVNDPTFETQSLLKRAINKKVVVVKNKQHYTEDGIKLAGKGEVASFNKSIRFLRDPKNQEIKDLLIAKTE
jgi:hypothetical protein